VVESRFDRPRIQGAGHLHWGRHALACNLYITFVIVTQFSPNILRNAISPRCRSDVFWHPRCSWATTGLSSLMQELKVMKNEKLKPTTVRFTDSDLHLIDCLQKKLGLRMIHIIRLAIRRLAENENLLPSNSAVKKRWEHPMFHQPLECPLRRLETSRLRIPKRSKLLRCCCHTQ